MTMKMIRATKTKKNGQGGGRLFLDQVKTLVKGGLCNVGRYKYSLVYIALIVLLNTLFARIPLMQIAGSEVSPMDWTVGIVYVLRDFSQRELHHKVMIAMLIGSVLSYFLADKTIALASVSAFLVAEVIDWAVYTFTRRPLSQRILWSASLSAPVDSSVFLWIVNQLNGLGVVILSLAKIVGVLAVWYGWRLREQRLKSAPSPSF
jgi:queuosine precursor transporter